ncbi:hypothetical protein, partial [Methylophaga sp. UBA5113]|uniref:hypothetical protein n=1 Tax=Methylophaga sp. UBA5113 TaxID=1946900 RepID=UPI0025CBB67C
WLKMHHSTLLVIYLEQLNCIPRALIGAFSVTTEAAMKDKQALVTVPMQICYIHFRDCEQGNFTLFHVQRT